MKFYSELLSSKIVHKLEFSVSIQWIETCDRTVAFSAVRLLLEFCLMCTRFKMYATRGGSKVRDVAELVHSSALLRDKVAQKLNS